MQTRGLKVDRNYGVGLCGINLKDCPLRTFQIHRMNSVKLVIFEDLRKTVIYMGSEELSTRCVRGNISDMWGESKHRVEKSTDFREYFSFLKPTYPRLK